MEALELKSDLPVTARVDCSVVAPATCRVEPRVVAPEILAVPPTSRVVLVTAPELIPNDVPK